jgi:Helix-turn-helix domain
LLTLSRIVPDGIEIAITVIVAIHVHTDSDGDNMKFAYNIPDAAEVSDTCKSTLYEEIAAGRLIARKRGKWTIILAEDLQDWLLRLPQIKTDTAA